MVDVGTASCPWRIPHCTIPARLRSPCSFFHSQESQYKQRNGTLKLVFSNVLVDICTASTGRWRPFSRRRENAQTATAVLFVAGRQPRLLVIPRIASCRPPPLMASPSLKIPVSGGRRCSRDLTGTAALNQILSRSLSINCPRPRNTHTKNRYSVTIVSRPPPPRARRRLSSGGRETSTGRQASPAR